MTSLARRVLELLVEPPLELPGDEVSDGVAPGPGGVLVAVAGRDAVPVLARLVAERLAPHRARAVLVANRPDDPDEWRGTEAVCLPPSRLAVALLARGRRARGPFGAALRELAAAIRAAGA